MGELRARKEGLAGRSLEWGEKQLHCEWRQRESSGAN